MASAKWMIVLRDDGWQIAEMTPGNLVVDDPKLVEEMQPQSHAQEIAEALVAKGYSSEPVMLALDSNWCLATRKPAPSPAHYASRQAVVFQLEESFPWEAEEMVADYVSHTKDLFAVAVQCPNIQPWIEALESSDLVIESLTPLTLLVVADHLTQREWPETHAVVWSHEGLLEVVVVEDGKPIDWRVVQTLSSSFLKQTLQAMILEGNGFDCTSSHPYLSESPEGQPIDEGEPRRIPVICYGADVGTLEAVRSIPELEVQEEQPLSSLVSLAARSAQKTLDAMDGPWIELRRDALATHKRFRGIRSREKWILAVAGMFLLALGAAMLTRAGRYDAQYQLANVQLTDAYRQVFPTGPIPVGVQSRLQSEFAKLKGIRGEASELPASLPAIDVLYHMLAALPKGMRYRILEIRIDQGRLDLSGQVRNHADVDQIAAALREKGFAVSPPSTERDSSNSVTVRITARRDQLSNANEGNSI